MNDQEIIDLYFARDERAISETAKSHGAACMRVSMNILANRSDAEECVNDTYLKAWNTIPPERPNAFRAWLCRVARNFALMRYRTLHRKKRNCEMEILYSELEECVPMPEDMSEGADTSAQVLGKHISNFLDTQEKLDRTLFLGRYIHGSTVQALAKACGMRENTVAVRLHRTREKLRAYLQERGYRI